MKYVFHPEAEEELVAAIDYYEDCEPGLGYDFAIEVHTTIENILSFHHVNGIGPRQVVGIIKNRIKKRPLFSLKLPILATKIYS
jgi:hypothetical protein